MPIATAKPHPYAQQLKRLRAQVTARAVANPTHLCAEMAEEFGVSRSVMGKWLRTMMDEGWLVREGTLARPNYKPGVLREVSRSYPLAGLDEQTPWEQDFSPCFALPAPITRMAHHAFTEIINNCVDHSGGTRVSVSMRQNKTHLHLLIKDDGCGVFARIQDAFQIASPQQALLELSKGKLTTQPDRHTGRGLFFTSRIFDVFDLYANQLTYQHSHWQRRDWLRANPLAVSGTAVFMSLALNTTRTLDDVFVAHARSEDDRSFSRTEVSMRLAHAAGEQLESRAQAKRIANRLEAFDAVDLDFEGVDAIGQAFADELFRVFAMQHPRLHLNPRNANARVRAMIEQVSPHPEAAPAAQP
jgi:anti-sigma regulatory factor (Ser/Thr protein kinase)